MKPQVLVVDDVGYIRAFLKKGLEAYGMQVDTFASVEEARLRLRSKKYDIILMDYYLKYTTGVDALEFIQTLQPEAKTIIITAFPREEMLQELTGHRIYGLVRKPMRIRDLYARLRKMLRDSETEAATSLASSPPSVAPVQVPDVDTIDQPTADTADSTSEERAPSDTAPVPEAVGGEVTDEQLLGLDPEPALVSGAVVEDDILAQLKAR